MILYHRTEREAVESILKHGFRDGTGHFLTENTHSGVWLSDRPLDENEGACGDTLLEVSTDLTEDELSEYCWDEPDKPYREFLIPAAIINPRMTVRVVEDGLEFEPT